jgi:uncharacterized membrane protein
MPREERLALAWRGSGSRFPAAAGRTLGQIHLTSVDPFGAASFGLASALAWGAGDYGGGLLSRRASGLGIVLVSQLVGMAIAAGIAVATTEPWPGPIDVAWSVVSGIAGVVGISCLYRGLAVGRMGTVAPVTAVLAAALPVLAGVLLEGLPSPTVLTGIGLAIVAVVLVSHVSDTDGRGRRGVGLALAAGTALGTFNVTIAHLTHGLVFGPLTIVRGVEALFVAVIIAATRTSWRLSDRILPLVLLVGVLDMSGNAFFILARQAGQLATAAALSSLYPVTTVILAAAFLRERITIVHALGIATATVAILLITTGSIA